MEYLSVDFLLTGSTCFSVTWISDVLRGSNSFRSHILAGALVHGLHGSCPLAWLSLPSWPGAQTWAAWSRRRKVPQWSSDPACDIFAT